jgi:hypothetical protein
LVSTAEIPTAEALHKLLTDLIEQGKKEE